MVIFFLYIFIDKKTEVLNAQSSHEGSISLVPFIPCGCVYYFNFLLHIHGDIYFYFPNILRTLLTSLLCEWVLQLFSEEFALSGKGKMIGRGETYCQIAEQEL